jgi:phosphopantetheinyl transferase
VSMAAPAAGEVDVWVSEPSAGAVGRALGAYAGPAARSGHDAHGRPVAIGRDDLRLSVSRCDGTLLVAVARRCRVGVDVEPIRERGLTSLPRHALTAGELAELERSPEPAAAFLAYWTRKEALLKAAGTGLAVDPRLVELAPPGGSPRPVAVPPELGRPEDWWLVALELEGRAAAVAVDVEAPAVRLHLLP